MQEIARQIEMRLETEVMALLQAKIVELDLVPRSMRGGQSPPGHSSLGSSGESSGISSHCDSPPQYHSEQMIPDSPADITMASPSVWGTPGFHKRDYADQAPQFGQFGQMLPPDSDPRPQPGAMLPPQTPRRTTLTNFAGNGTLEEDEDSEETAIFQPNEDTAIKTRHSTTFLGGSPIRPSRRPGFQKSGTTSNLLDSAERKTCFGLGGRGSSRDDVATARKPNGGDSMSRARSIVEIQRMQRLMGPAPKWDPNNDDAPSPFLKRNTRRYR